MHPFPSSYNSASSPPYPQFFPQLYFPMQATLHSRLFRPVASVMFAIDYLGQSSIFCEFDSYLILCFAFFCRVVKAQEGENFSDNQSAARVLSFGVFKVHTVGGSKRFSCLFSHAIALEAPWIPRSLNGKADLLRRFSKENHLPVNPHVFRVVEAKWGPRTNLNPFTSYYRAFSFRVLTPSLLLLVVGVSDAFVRD